MSTKLYYKNKIADCQKRIIGLKASIAKTKEDKKKKAEQLAKQIKNATGTSKDSYKRQKINSAAEFDRKVESIKKSVESVKAEITRHRNSMKSAK